MRSVSLRLVDLQKSIIPIGFVDENLHTQVRIDCKKLFEEYPNAIPSLAVSPPAGDAYPVEATKDGDWVIWNVSASDVQQKGTGLFQLTFTTGEVIAKSYIGHFKVNESVMPSGTVPTPIQSWIEEANTTLGQVEQALTDIPQAIETGLQETIDDTAGAGVTNKVWSADKDTSELALKLNKNNPVYTGTLKLDVETPGYDNYATGEHSVALGVENTSSGQNSFTKGFLNTASGTNSSAEGRETIADGSGSHTEGRKTRAYGSYTHAEGFGTTAIEYCQHTAGQYNVPSRMSEAAEWKPHTYYTEGEPVRYNDNGTWKYYVCRNPHTSRAYLYQEDIALYWEECGTNNSYVEIVGIGANGARKNGRALDWNGNERLKGDLYVKCNSDSTGGTKVAKITDVYDLIATQETSPSTHAYSQGDCFIFNGKLCRATSAISVDDEIEIGTSCEQTTLMEEIRR